MKGGDCKFFTGYQNGTCKAGVNYRKLVGGPNLGWAARLPCLPNSPFRKEQCVCDKFSPMTLEEAQAEERSIKATFDQFLTARTAALATKLEHGIITCPRCSGKLRFNTKSHSRGVRVVGHCGTPGCLQWTE